MAVANLTEHVSLAEKSIRICKQRKRGKKIADSLGNELTGGGVLMRAMILRWLLARHVLAQEERVVGLLLPPTVAGVVANLALALDRRTVANLNYTLSSEVNNACLAQAGIRHVVTSRAFMEKIQLELDAELVYLEDFRARASWRDKLNGALAAFGVPASLLSRCLGLHQVRGEDLNTVVFTSGSTGLPKGVMLTEANISSNVRAVQEAIALRREDVLLGILPFFHSFGYTATLWTVLTIDVQGVYHYTPLEGRQIGKLCKKHGATVLLATPTFLGTYLRRCDADDFRSLDVVLVGAEKLPRDVADAFESRFGVRPVEGYGTTELSPLVSVNIPASRALPGQSGEVREGTVGRPLPGINARVTDLETGQVLGPGQPGMLWIQGPNVMKGYWGREDLTSEVIQDGWYRTGDVAVIDHDGFIQITGRESRFSKIGGEMVPHLHIEAILNEILSEFTAPPEDSEGPGGPMVAVTAVPDAKKGERLVVVHTELPKSPQELCRALADRGLPNLYVPSPDSFHQVPTMPVLGTGKLDLRALKQVALDAFPPKE